ncbi:MAG: flagellar basal body P-ring formation chaperone FlgA, partial [Bdellovibrionales bacterium]
DSIMLSDIFTDLPSGKDKVLGPAPYPGKEMVLNARMLMRIAMALDLPWRPQSSAEYVSISRSATVINTDMITDVLKSEISDLGYDGAYQIAYSGAMPEIILPNDQPQSLEIKSLNTYDGTDRFDAVLVAPSAENPLQTVQVSGALNRMVDIPVLREAVRSGTIIGKNDIDYITIREAALRHDMVMSKEELIGMTPRRIILQDKPIKTGDLEAPQVIKRGDLITMRFSHRGMQLTAQGKALENGAKGDVIRVSNSASNKNLEALVVGEREVEVKSF